MAAGGSGLAAMLVILGLLHGAAASTYLVGQSGSNGGWTFVGQTSYDDQFKGIDLVVGDKLSFVFATGDHNVLEVIPGNVAGCNATSPISTHTDSVQIVLDTAGEHGFICSVPNHCPSGGMHLLVTVQESIAASPEQASPEAGGPEGPGGNAASLLRSGPAMVVGAVLAACAVLFF